MNRLIYYLSLLILIFIPVILQGQNYKDIIVDRYEETEGSGLVIMTNPQGVNVYIDGVYRGQTPVNIQNLQQGACHIRLTKEGYKEKYLNTVIRSNNQTSIFIRMEEVRGIVYVTIRKSTGSPEKLYFNPQIFTDSEGEISFPLIQSDQVITNISLPAGYNVIRARAFGWEETSITVNVNEYRAAYVNLTMSPSLFKIEKAGQSRKRFNPDLSGSLGTVEYRYMVTAQGTGTITVINKDDDVIYKRRLNEFNDWNQSVTWDGRNISGEKAAQGIYTAIIEVVPLYQQDQNESKPASQLFAIKYETEINYSISIYPLSLASGISGLIFSPAPAVLPAGSFQIQSSLLFGSFLSKDSEKPFSHYPFQIGARFSFLNNLEFAAAFNVNSGLQEQAGWGISSSVKYNFLKTNGKLPFSVASCLSYSWVNKYGESPQNPAKGIGLYVPLSLELAMFSFIFTPGLFWEGPSISNEDFPLALLLCAGFFYRNDWITTGISIRPEIHFRENSNQTKILSGIEAHFRPIETSLIFTINAGMWNKGSQIGGFGGIGIGFIY